MKGQQENIALRSINKAKNKASKKNTDNQNKIQKPEWSDDAWEAQKAAVAPSGGACDSILGSISGQNMEPYVYVRLLKKDRSKTGLADKTASVSVVNEQAVFRDTDANELLEDCSLTTKQYPDPGELLIYLRVYDDDVGDDDCIGQAILEVRDVVDNRGGKESFASIPIYDEEHGEMMCHCEMSAQWRKSGEGGTIAVKIFRLYDFREDIDSGESAAACLYMLYFLIYVLIGAALFKAFEPPDWGCNGYFDAVWFMVITITSVGYGDCFPTQTSTKILNFVMIITNILCIGWMFSIAVQQMIVMQERLQRQLKGQIQNTMWQKGDGPDGAEGDDSHAPMTKEDDFRTTTIMCVVLIVLTCLIYGLNTDEMCEVSSWDNKKKEWSASSCSADPFLTNVDKNGVEFVVKDSSDNPYPLCGTSHSGVAVPKSNVVDGKCPNTTLSDGVYPPVCCYDRTNDAGFQNFWDVLQFTVVTMATVGYGDVSPKTTWGKVYGMFFAMIGVAALARLGALVVDSVMEAAHREKMEKILGQTLTSLDELSVFDSDGDGKIDKYEFLMKMLVMTHECSQDTIDRIMGRFYQIDKDGDGDIDAEDFLKGLKNKIPNSPTGDAKISVDSKLQSA